MEQLDTTGLENKLSDKLPEKGVLCMFYLRDGEAFEGVVSQGMHGPLVRTVDYKQVYPYEKFNLIRGWRLL